MCVYLCFNVLVSVNTSTTTTTTLRLSYFQLNLTSLSQQMAVFSSISQNWILMNSTMNSQARNYFPISPHDIPPSLCITGINTWSVPEMLHQVMQDLIRSLKFWANQVWGSQSCSFYFLILEKESSRQQQWILSYSIVLSILVKCMSVALWTDP